MPDYQVSRNKMLAHVAELAAATHLPVSADMEAGYADTLDGVVETYRLTAQTGLQSKRSGPCPTTSR